jgi:hypothetical protein
MTILSTIMGVESGGGRNIVQGNIGDVNNRTGDLAKGYFQITNATWAQFGGLSTGYTQANAAPYATQLQIAQNIPVARWGPDTQSALSSAGYSPTRGQTLGQLMSVNNESPSATTAADGSTVSGSGTTIANGPTDSSGTGDNSGVTADSNPLGASVTQNPSGTSSTTTSDTGTGVQETQGLQQGTIAAITSWISGIESATGGAFSGAVKAAETAIGTYFSSIQNWFVRAFLIIVGIVIVGVALIALLWDHGGQKVAGQMQTFAAA